MKKQPTDLNPPDNARRRFFRTAGGAIGIALLANALPSVVQAEDLPHLTTDDPTAKALNYTEDASKAPPPHQAGQACANCNFFQGGSAAYGPCQLFPGKAVAAKGWCSGYAKKA
ncbi:MAG TPA: high-potential iron-sulfur protein [Rudaea sp.]